MENTSKLIKSGDEGELEKKWDDIHERTGWQRKSKKLAQKIKAKNLYETEVSNGIYP